MPGIVLPEAVQELNNGESAVTPAAEKLNL